MAVPDEFLGRNVKCAQCGAVFTAEASGSSVAPPRGDSYSGRSGDDRDWRQPDDTPPSPRWQDPYDRGPYGGSFRPRPTREDALGKVKAPAIILMIYGVLLCLTALGCFLGAVLTQTSHRQDDRIAGLIIFGVGGLISLVLGALTVFAGQRLMVLKNYAYVMTIVILTMVFAVLTCVPAVLVAIWPLIVLVDRQVKDAFDLPVEY